MRFLLAIVAGVLYGQGPANVLIVANKSSAVSKTIAEYYSLKRRIPATQVCYIETPPAEKITREVYQRDIAGPVARCLAREDMRERILYIVTTLGVPLCIPAAESVTTEAASVDSELALLYSDMGGVQRRLAGPHPNPFYGERVQKFSHPKYPMYLVTRLAAYEFADVRAMIDRSLQPANRGTVVLDLNDGDDASGNRWLRDAAIRLPARRFILEETKKVLYGQREVIGYGAWGSNDKNRHDRFVHFQWLAGAIVSEFVSTNARTFEKPPADWTISSWSNADAPKWFHGSPQTLLADYLHEGATGGSGHVLEPYLAYCPQPEILFPAYLSGRNLAESFYMAIPAVSWMNIVVGDPLCRLQ